MAKRKITKMSKALFQRWCEALRSGKYRQGPGRLKHGTAFCCLGVLDDLAGSVSVSTEILTEGPGKCIFVERSLQNHLTDLNDSQEVSFSEIADFLEKETHIVDGELRFR